MLGSCSVDDIGTPIGKLRPLAGAMTTATEYVEQLRRERLRPLAGAMTTARNAAGLALCRQGCDPSQGR